MKILRLNQKGFIYFLNSSLLVITYFMVRILPLPLVLYLYGSTTGSIVSMSFYEIPLIILRIFVTIPMKCQLGCVVFYSLQSYWFMNIFRSWIRTVLSYINSCSLLHTQHKIIPKGKKLYTYDTGESAKKTV